MENEWNIVDDNITRLFITSVYRLERAWIDLSVTIQAVKNPGILNVHQLIVRRRVDVEVFLLHETTEK